MNLHHAAARTARELADAFKAHGCTIQVVPQVPVDGQVFLAIHDPLSGYEAQLLTAALSAYTGGRPRCEECQTIKRNRARALRDGNRDEAAEMATVMGIHQRMAHT
ncbi:hypothetical protein [Streptomyces cinnamoneus]|uniref:Uncharacterized protein n=1 Tax=Streptomyces cinnamoneus TaxID=53446 RepID=A0A918TQF7_STRCJ|nr:hypothetical protein [Streptomyces cinnamoneus]GHC58687.1 hypothetical protein GCM10010507_39270 [Streptomyces cinnamoneus]